VVGVVRSMASAKANVFVRRVFLTSQLAPRSSLLSTPPLVPAYTVRGRWALTLSDSTAPIRSPVSTAVHESPPSALLNTLLLSDPT
jgi:hypothetical protein